MRFLVSGPPSSGKSTQGRLLAADCGVPHISSGALIREAASAGDPDARRVLAMVSDGSLAPSDYISRLVISRISRDDCSCGFVLDGFPRRTEEAAALMGAGLEIDAAFVLTADPAVLTARVVRRAGEGRVDDDPAAFPHRLDVYAAETVPVRDVLSGSGVRLVDIDASGPSLTTHSLVTVAIDRLGLRRDAAAPVPA